MSEKSVQEILDGVRNATDKVRSDKEPKSDKNGNVLKSLFKTYIFDNGDSEETAIPAAIQLDENDGFADMPKFEVNTADTNDLSAKPLSEIYTEAGVESSFSVEQLEAMVNSDELKSQPLNMKLVAVPFALKQQGVTLDVPISDAANRDAALDGYALMLSKRAYRGRNENEEKVKTIEDELQKIFAEKQAEIDNLRADSAKKENEYQTFLQVKAEEEKRMADIISPFLAGKANPITVGNVPVDEEEAVVTASVKKG